MDWQNLQIPSSGKDGQWLLDPQRVLHCSQGWAKHREQISLQCTVCIVCDYSCLFTSQSAISSTAAATMLQSRVPSDMDSLSPNESGVYGKTYSSKEWSLSAFRSNWLFSSIIHTFCTLFLHKKCNFVVQMVNNKCGMLIYNSRVCPPPLWYLFTHYTDTCVKSVKKNANWL